MPIDETVRSYQTKGEPVTHKQDTPTPYGTMRPEGVAVQFNDVKKKELDHGDCPGCMY